MKNILTRHSVRKYRNLAVPPIMLDELLKAAQSAPSAGNQKPWHFVIIDDRKVLDGIAEVHPYAQMLRTAPAAILICGEERLEKFKGFWVQDCSAATQNLLIAANSLDLGGVWVGVYPIEERVVALRKLLGIPSEVTPFSLVPIGFPDDDTPRDGRYDASRLHLNLWGTSWPKPGDN